MENSLGSLSTSRHFNGGILSKLPFKDSYFPDRGCILFLGKVMSVLNAFSVGVGVSVGPYVGAYIKDVTGGYYWALIIAIIVRLCGTCCAILGMRFDKIKRLD